MDGVSARAVQLIDLPIPPFWIHALCREPRESMQFENFDAILIPFYEQLIT